MPRPLPPSVESSAQYVPRPPPIHPVPDHPWGSFVKRCLSWWNETIVPLARDPGDRTVLVTSHGAYILVRPFLPFQNPLTPRQTLFRQLTTPPPHGPGYHVHPSLPPFRHCANTSVSVITLDTAGRGCVVRFDDHSHLGAGQGSVVSRDVAA